MTVLHFFIFLSNISLHLIIKAKELFRVELSLLFQHNIPIFCVAKLVGGIVMWFLSVLWSELWSSITAKFIHKCRNFIHYHPAVFV